MSAPFQKAIAFTLLWEGGYVNHPNDPGGATRYGITERFARAHGYTGSMRSLPLNLAKKWYKESIWDRYELDAVAQGSPEVAGYLFDMAVNHGGWTRIAQRAVNHYLSVVEDGVWGPNTRNALAAVAADRSMALLDALRVERCRYVRDLCERNGKLRVFLFGWLRRYLA